jgi:hypothetical protein
LNLFGAKSWPDNATRQSAKKNSGVAIATPPSLISRPGRA